MEDRPVHLLPRAVVVAVVLSALLGGIVGGAVTGLALRDPDAGPAVLAVPALDAGPEVDRVAAVAAAVLPSVVRVDVRGIGAGGDGGGSGNASGVLIDDRGHVVTNHHVIAGASGITVTFVDRTTVDAVLVGSDPANDVAVLQVDAPDLPAIAVGDSEQVRVGQMAVAVGSPFGLSGSVTAGIVSAVDRPVDLRVPGGQVVRLPGVIQTDAGMSPGNSGGPLVDSAGRMVGLNSAVLSEDFGGGVGFAVPSSTVVQVVADLIADGRVTTPWLGLSGTTQAGTSAGSGQVAGGVAVDRVQPGSPAAEAGVQPDDVVTAVDGVALLGMDDLVAVVRAAGVGATIVLDVVRDGTPQSVPVTLGDTP